MWLYLEADAGETGLQAFDPIFFDFMASGGVDTVYYVVVKVDFLYTSETLQEMVH